MDVPSRLDGSDEVVETNSTSEALHRAARQPGRSVSPTKRRSIAFLRHWQSPEKGNGGVHSDGAEEGRKRRSALKSR